jgi:hypothetical protein
LTVLDISSLPNPTIIGNVGTGGFAEGVAVDGNTAFLCDPFLNPDFRVYSVANPQNPVFLGGVAIPGDPTEVAIIGSFAYIADRDGSLAVVDVSSPSNPVYLGSVATPSGAFAVVPAFPNVAVADTFGGLLLFLPQCPLTTAISDQEGAVRIMSSPSASPNPFAHTTAIRFALDREALVGVSIYNASGRLVRSIQKSNYGPGENQVAWDARTDSHEMVRAGVYFYRIEAGSVTSTGRVVLLD